MHYKILLLFVFCSGLVSSQNITDSLLSELKAHPKSDTIRCNLLMGLIDNEEDVDVWIKYNKEIESICTNKLSLKNQNKKLITYYKSAYGFSLYNSAYYYATYNELRKSLVYAEKALSIHKELNKKDEISADLNVAANATYNLGNTDVAIRYFNESIAISRSQNYTEGIINGLHNISNIYYDKGDLKKSIDYQFEILKIAENVKSDKDIADALTKIGSLYFKQNEYEKALEYYNRSLPIQKRLNDKNGMATIYFNIGKLFLEKKLYEKALYYFGLSKQLETKNESTATLVTTGITYYRMKDYDNAIKLYNEALPVVEKSENREDQAEVYKNLAFVWFDKKDYDKALAFGEKSLSIAQSIHNMDASAESAGLLYKIHKLKNNSAKALQLLELSTLLNDSLNRKENRNAALKADFKYETEKKESAIKELTQEKTISELQSQRKSVFIYSILGGIVAIALLSYFLFARYKTKKQNELLKIQLEEAQKTIEAEKKAAESELKALKSQMNPHFIFNALNSIQEQFMYGDKLKGNEQLGNFTYLTRQILTVSGKKQIPLSTEIEILQKYLELEKMRFQNDFEYLITFSDRIDEDYLQLPPMLIQPFVENSIKHGLLHKQGRKILSVHFDLSEQEDFIICTIEDNGIGRTKSSEIKAGNAGKHASFSTGSIEQRLELLNQNLKLNNLIVYEDLKDQDQTDNGTRVSIKIPLA